VIVDDLNIMRAPITPPKTNSPLVVDTNAVLTTSCFFQGLQAIPWWHTQILQTTRDLQLQKLSPGHSRYVHELLYRRSVKQGFSVCVSERSEHVK
jgi:hypothetical protein